MMAHAEVGMPPNLKLNAVAFISPQNHPILVKAFSKQEYNGIKYQYIAHTSLDVIEERGERYVLEHRTAC